MLCCRVVHASQHNRTGLIPIEFCVVYGPPAPFEKTYSPLLYRYPVSHLETWRPILSGCSIFKLHIFYERQFPLLLRNCDVIILTHCQVTCVVRLIRRQVYIETFDLISRRTQSVCIYLSILVV